MVSGSILLRKRIEGGPCIINQLTGRRPPLWLLCVIFIFAIAHIFIVVASPTLIINTSIAFEHMLVCTRRVR